MLLTRRVNRRRGIVAVTLALAIMLLLFVGLTAFMLVLATSGMRVDSSHDTAQAIYAAEAGIDVALQTGGTGTATGNVGRGRYALRATGTGIVAVGEIERASGVPARAGVAVDVAGGGMVRGSWRLVPPAQETDLIAALAQTRVVGH